MTITYCEICGKRLHSSREPPRTKPRHVSLDAAGHRNLPDTGAMWLCDGCAQRLDVAIMQASEIIKAALPANLGGRLPTAQLPAEDDHARASRE